MKLVRKHQVLVFIHAFCALDTQQLPPVAPSVVEASARYHRKGYPFQAFDARGRDNKSSRDLRRIFEHLSSPDCQLFSETGGAVPISEDNLQSLLAAGGDSASTLAYLRELDRKHWKFRTLSQLIDAVDKTRQAIFKTKKSIFRYLCSAECRLFGLPVNSNEGGATVFLTMADIDRLVQTCGMGVDTLGYIKGLDVGTTTFRSFNELENAIRNVGQFFGTNRSRDPDHRANVTKAVKRRASTGVHLTIGEHIEVATPLEQHYVNSEWQDVLAFLTSPECTLFPNSPKMKATATQMDKLIRAGGGSDQTIEILNELQWDGNKYQSFADLIADIEAEGAQTPSDLHTSDKDRQSLMSYLAGPECKLFAQNGTRMQIRPRTLDRLLRAGNGSFVEAQRHLQSLQGRGTMVFSPTELMSQLTKERDRRLPGDHNKVEKESILKFLSEAECELFGDVDSIRVQNSELERLVRQCGASALFHFRYFNQKGYRYESFTQLVKATASAHTQAGNTKLEVLKFLSSPDCTLLADAAELTLTDVDRIYTEGKAGPETLDWIKKLQSEKQDFESVSSLAEAVEALFITSTENSKNVVSTSHERQEIITYLASGKCYLFNEDVDIHITKGDLNRMISEAGSVRNTLVLLKSLSNDNRQFKDFVEIIPAIKALVLEQQQCRKDLFVRLNDRNCPLFMLNVSLSSDQVGQLFEEAGGLLLPGYLDAIEVEGCKFPDFNQLLEAATSFYTMKEQERDATNQESPETRLNGRRAILAYISSPECTLFDSVSPVEASEITIDSLLSKAEGANQVLLHLKYLTRKGLQCSSFDEVYAAVMDCQRQCNEEHTRLLKFLSRSDCHLLDDADTPIHHKMSDMLRLYSESTAGPETMYHLARLEEARMRFASLNELIEAIRNAHSTYAETARTQMNMITAYLLDPVCSLFYEAPSAIQRSQVYQLFHISGRGPSCILHLEKLNRDGRKFETVEELMPAIAHLNQQIIPVKSEIHALLSSPSCPLLPKGTHISMRDVEKLVEVGQAHTETILHLRELAYGGGSYMSIDALADAVADAQTRSLESRSAECVSLLAWISGPYHRLSSEPLVASMDNLRSLVEISGGGQQALMYLSQLFAEGRTFSSVDFLLEAIGKLADQDENVRGMLYDLFTDQNQTLFLEGSNVHLQQEDDRFKHLLALEPSVKQIAQVCTELASDIQKGNQRSFDSFPTFLVAVRQGIQANMEKRKLLKQMITAYVLNNKHFKQLLGDSFQRAQHIEISDVDIDRMLAAAEGDGTSLVYYLEKMQHSKDRFSDIHELVNAIKDKFQRREDIKLEAYKFLSRKDCRVFGGKSIQVSIQDIDRLCADSKVGHALVVYLASFEACKRSFATLYDLTRAIALQVSACNDIHSLTLQMVMAFLVGSNLNLIEGELYLCEGDLERLVKAAHDAPSALAILGEFQEQQVVFKEFHAVVREIARRESNHRRIKSHLYKYLTGPAAIFYKDSREPVAITMTKVERLLRRGNAGIRTLEHLKQLGSTIAEMDFESLIKTIRTSQTVGHQTPAVAVRRLKTNMNDPKKQKMVLEFVKQNQASFFAATGKKVGFKKSIVLKAAELEQLIHAGGGASNTLDHLKFFVSSGVTFRTFAEMVKVVEQYDTRCFVTKKTILGFLTGPRCNLLGTGAARNMLNFSDMDDLFKETFAGPYILLHLENLNDAGRTFNTFDALKQAVLNVHASSFKHILAERELVSSHLSRQDCKVLGSLRVTQLDLDFMLATGKSASNTIVCLKRLEDQRDSFERVDDLLAAFNETAQDVADIKRNIWKFLASANCNLLSDIVITGPVVDIFFERAEAGSETYSILLDLEKKGRKYANVLALAAAVKEEHHAGQERLEAELFTITTYLASPDCNLLEDAASFDNDDIVKLVRAGGNGSSTLKYLQRFHSEGRKYPNLSDLSKYVKRLHVQATFDKDQMRSFLRSDRCNLFDSASALLFVSESDIDELYEKGGAGSLTIHHLHSFQEKGRTFSSVKLLAEALSSVHLRNTEHGNNLLNDENRALINDHLQQSWHQLFSYSQEDFRLSKFDLDVLLEIGGGVRMTLNLLTQADTSQKRFKRFHELVEYIRNTKNAMKARRKDMLQFMNSSSCTLVPTNLKSVISSPKKASLNRDLEDLLDEFGFDSSLIRYVSDMSVMKQTFKDFKELASALRGAQKARQKTDASIIAQVLNHMLHPGRGLFVLPTKLDRSDVAHLLETTGAGLCVLECLEELEADERKFKTLDALVEGVKEVFRDERSHRQKVQEFLERYSRNLFSSPIEIRQNHVGQLFAIGMCGAATLAHLRMYLVSQRTFANVMEMAKALQISALSWNDRHYVDRSMIVGHLQGPLCKLCLFPVSKTDINFLLEMHANDAASLLYALELANDGRRLENGQDLKELLRQVQSFINKNKKLVLEVLIETSIFGDEVGPEDIDQLYEQGAGGHTSAILREFKSQGKKFDSFKSLVHAVYMKRAIGDFDTDPVLVTLNQHVKKNVISVLKASKVLHPVKISQSQCRALVASAGSLENLEATLKKMSTKGVSYSDVDALLIAVATSQNTYEKADAAHEKIISFLSSEQCLLFQSSKGSLSVTGELLDVLLDVAGGLDEALTHLRRFNQVGRRFKEFDEIVSATKLASTRGCHVDETVRKSLVDALNGRSRALLSNSEVHITGVDVDIMAAEEPDATVMLSHFRELERVGRQFGTIDELVLAVREAKTSGTYVGESDRQDLVEFFGTPGCRIFEGAGDTLEITQEILDEFIIAAGGGRRSLDAVRLFNQQGRRFSRFEHLLPALTSDFGLPSATALEEVDASTKVDPEHQLVIDVLVDPANNLCSQTLEIDLDVMDHIISNAHGAQSLISQLRMFKQAGRTFASCDELVEALAQASNEGAHAPADGHDAVEEYLLSSDCQLLGFGNSKPVLNKQHLELLVEVAKGSKPLLQILKRLGESKCHYLHFEDLLAAVGKSAGTVVITSSDRKQFVEFLSSSSCSVFDDAGDHFEVTIDELDKILKAAGGVEPATKVLQDMSEMGVRCQKMLDLIPYMKSLQGGDPGVYQVIVEYLSSSNCMLFSNMAENNIEVVEEDLQKLLRAGGSLSGLLDLLRQMNDSGQAFGSVGEMVTAVGAIAQSRSMATESRQAIVQYLSDPECNLFSNCEDNLQVTAAELDRLLHAGEGKQQTLNLLKKLNKSQKSFSSLKELTQAVASLKEQPNL